MKRTAATISLFAVLAACGGDAASFGEPKTLPGDRRPTVWGASARVRLGLPQMGATGGQKQVVATTPSGWEELPPNPQRFRNAVWRVAGQPSTDCYLTIGVGGGVQGNLGRWYRNQFGKTEVPALEALPVVRFADRPGRLAEIEGTFGGKQEQAALIAFFHEGQQVTSLKFTGPSKVVQANRDKFLALAESVRLGTPSPNPNAPMIQRGQPMPEGHPATGAAGSTAAGGANPDLPPGHANGGAPFAATVPDGWTKMADTRRTLHHKFGASGEGEVYVSQLGGGLKSSLDIWRGEIGLGPMSQAEFDALPKTMFLGDDAVLMDLSGTFRSMTGRTIENARLMVAARVDGSTITFAKLVGTAQDVAANATAFAQFCGSVRK